MVAEADHGRAIVVIVPPRAAVPAPTVTIAIVVLGTRTTLFARLGRCFLAIAGRATRARSAFSSIFARRALAIIVARSAFAAVFARRAFASLTRPTGFAVATRAALAAARPIRTRALFACAIFARRGGRIERLHRRFDLAWLATVAATRTGAVAAIPVTTSA